MRKDTTDGVRESRPSFASLEEAAREKVRGWLQDLLEQEVTEFLGRGRAERRVAVDAGAGYRNGFGKPRKLTLSSGTIELRRPRVRGVEERFESRLLPLFVRRTPEVSDLLPELYLHGLSTGDFDLALRGLLGEGAPISASTVMRVKEKWQGERKEWAGSRLEDLEVVLSLGGWGLRESGAGEGEGGVAGCDRRIEQRDQGGRGGDAGSPGVDGELVGALAGFEGPRDELAQAIENRKI